MDGEGKSKKGLIEPFSGVVTIEEDGQGWGRRRVAVGFSGRQ